MISAAVTDGLLKQNISPSDVPGNCPTGNCTWENYRSMGVCSNVVDVSSTITSRCRNTNRQYYPDGCNYSVPAIDKNPTDTKTTLQTHVSGETLWIGVSNPTNFNYPDINTLVQFYVIYVPDFTVWDTFDYTEDHKDVLVALQATLNLCLYTYSSNMTNGVTNTTQISKVTDLDWQIGGANFMDGTSGIQTVITTLGSETFGMSQPNVKSFNAFLSYQTFTGSASMRSAASAADSVGNITENDNVRMIAASIYDDHAGIQGLSKLLDGLTVSMTNAYALTDILSHYLSTLTA